MTREELNKILDDHKCCMCGDVFDVGFEMPNGDCVCATHECCYEYCRCEGKRITQESEAK